ncbi:MAG: AAA family ATPase, partial [Chloroflexi bacterium]|nr:AAA family ATPase [Chloroflexota bacterium]
KHQELAVVSVAGGPAASAAVDDCRPAKLTRAPARPRAVRARQRHELAQQLANHELEDTLVEIELTGDSEGYDSYWGFSSDMSSEELSESFNEFMQHYSPGSRKRRRRVSVRDARRLLTREEAFKLIDFDLVVEEALEKVENAGVVFIDELDKVAGVEAKSGPDVSGEGVQRDLLPIVEGSTVMTRYGPVKTEHILFIAAGAFYQSKPSDLIPELQGRFPLRVELDGLTQHDLERILTEPENSFLKQYQALLATEGVELEFSPDGIAEIAAIARDVNRRTENIGARRLNTVLERALEDVSFEAPERQGERVVVDQEFVRSRLSDVVQDEDLSRYIV